MKLYTSIPTPVFIQIQTDFDLRYKFPHVVKIVREFLCWITDQARAEIRLCYPLVAMCAHDCVPNTFRCIDARAERGGDGFLQVRRCARRS